MNTETQRHGGERGWIGDCRFGGWVRFAVFVGSPARIHAGEARRTGGQWTAEQWVRFAPAGWGSSTCNVIHPSPPPSPTADFVQGVRRSLAALGEGGSGLARILASTYRG